MVKREEKNMVRRPLNFLLLLCLSLFFLPGTYFEQSHQDFRQEKRLNQHLNGQQRARLGRNDIQRGVFPVWVYFKDKGIREVWRLEKALAETQLNLNPRCLWRRAKVLTNRPLVDYDDLPVHPAYKYMVERIARRVRTTSRWLNAMSVDATPRQIRVLASLPFVRRIDPVLSFARREPPPPGVLNIPPFPDDPLFWQYGRSFVQLSQINVPPLHRLGYSGNDVLVCMMDTGFCKSHEAFQHAPIIAEWDFVNNDGDVNPDTWRENHGTSTWSMLGGFKTGELIGPAYGASFLLAKTESVEFERPIEEDYWVAGIEWAESLGAEVVSSSLGYIDWYSFADMDGETAVTTRAANRAFDLGVVVVNAAGNERDTPWGHIIAPADGFNVIACGAVDSLGSVTDFSSPGPTYDGRIKPEVCALGERAWQAVMCEGGNPTDYGIGAGTSFSTPLVAGVCALLLEIHRDWTPTQVRSALLSTASQSQSPDNDYGWGILDAAIAADLGLPSILFRGYSVDDDSFGESLGNGNGRAEPGETLEISVTVKNNGRDPVSGLHGSLSTAHPEVVISVAEADFPLLAPSESGQINRPFVATIPPDFLGHDIIFWLRIAGPNDFLLLNFLRIPVSR